MTTIRNVETQVGQIAKQLAEGQSGQFSANIQTNPKEHCNTIVTKNGRIAGEMDGNNVVAEKERWERERKEKD